MSKINRRDFLKLSGGATVGAATLRGAWAAEPQSEPGRTTLPYPQTAIGRAQDLKVGQPLSFSYPDPASPCALLKTGKPSPGGVGPDGDIVAYSTLCSHMGCPVAYDAQAGTFKCGCHFSMFDPEKGGQQLFGQATVNLPQIELAYDAKSGDITAVGVQGLIYGRQANIL